MGRRPRVLAVGEVLWDVIERAGEEGEKWRLGGAPFNFGYYAAALGAESRVISAVGLDPPGRRICRMAGSGGGFVLAGRRSTPAGGRGQPPPCILHLQRDPRHPTGLVRVRVDERGEPTFRILQRRAWDFIACRPGLRRLAAGADLFYFGTLAQRSPRTRRTVRLLAAETAGLRLCDLNLRQPFFDEEVIAWSLSAADILKLNRREFEVIRGMFSLGEGRLRAARRLMRRFGIGLVCITLGERGAWLADGENAVEVAGRRATVADTVGAGDAFAASLAVDYLLGRDLESIGRAANRLGALVAEHPGALLPRHLVQPRL